MRQSSPRKKNSNETQETEKATFLVVKRIREAILDEVFKPGDHFGEAELAEKFEVSRSSVRETLLALEKEGTRSPGKFLFLLSGVENALKFVGCLRFAVLSFCAFAFVPSSQRALMVANSPSRIHRSLPYYCAACARFFPASLPGVRLTPTGRGT